MIRLTILREAEVELRESVAYYENKSRGLGIDYLLEVETSLLAVSRFPERGPLLDDGSRRYLLSRFPYVVVYVYVNTRVWVVAFAHCKRRPGYWLDRVKEKDKTVADRPEKRCSRGC